MNPFEILTAAERAESVSLAVAIAVIVLLFLVAAGIFFLYYRYFGKCIDNRLEDQGIRRDIVIEHKEYFRKGQEVLSQGGKIAYFHDYCLSKKKKSTAAKVAANCFLGVFYLALITLMASAIYVRASGDIFYVGDTSYLVIMSSSMEEKNTANAYLEENHLDDQISALSLVAIKKTPEEEIGLYDVAAFHDDDGNIIVHRIIAISEKEGEVLYTMRGDANASSASYERDLAYEELLGIWTGFQNFGVGLTVQYLQSGIGIISVALGLILVGFYDILDIALGNKIALRREDLIMEMDIRIEKAFRHKESEFPYIDILQKRKGHIQDDGKALPEEGAKKKYPDEEVD